MMTNGIGNKYVVDGLEVWRELLETEAERLGFLVDELAVRIGKLEQAEWERTEWERTVCEGDPNAPRPEGVIEVRAKKETCDDEE